MRDLRHSPDLFQIRNPLPIPLVPVQGELIRQLPLLITLLATVPRMSTIKAGHVRDTAVTRVLAPPPPPCGCVRGLDIRPWPRFATGP